MAEKTEKATPKKLRDARKKGQVAKSQDFPSAFTFVVAIVGTLFLSGYFFRELGNFIILMFKEAGTKGDFATKAAGYMLYTLQIILEVSLPLVVVVTFIGILASFIVVGPVFSFEAIKFEFKRLNPIEGIKQKFKIRTLIELIKSIVKITAAAIIIYFVIWNMVPEVLTTVTMPVIGGAYVLNDFLIKVTIRVGILFIIIGLFDLAFQKRVFGKEMMMEKFEVKQEYRDTEGDPLTKGRRREAFREIAYQEGPSAARRARAIITNPTHIAVALGYEEKDPAPMILTMGQGEIASEIIRIGLELKIPIMRNPELAQALFYKGKISDYIPEDTYQAIAEILKWVKSLEEATDVNMELFK